MSKLGGDKFNICGLAHSASQPFKCVLLCIAQCVASHSLSMHPQDGLLSREEVGEMVLPLSYDPTVAEAKHLIFHADLDKVAINPIHPVENSLTLYQPMTHRLVMTFVNSP